MGLYNQDGYFYNHSVIIPVVDGKVEYEVKMMAPAGPMSAFCSIDLLGYLK